MVIVEKQFLERQANFNFSNHKQTKIVLQSDYNLLTKNL